MLGRTQRVSNRQFEEVMKKGRPLHSPLFLILHVETGREDGARIAAVAPVKIAKTAVVRNRTRRRIYESVKPFASQLRKGVVMAIFAKAPALKAKPAEMSTNLKELFVKAGLMR